MNAHTHLSTQFGIALVTCGLVAAMGAATVAQDAGKSVNAGVYSAAQAERGRKTFESACTTCHDPGRFTGADFVKQWSGQPLHSLYDTMSTTMPEDNPGGLEKQQYADILAYFLSLNKYPTGDADLKGDPEAMKTLAMEAPKSSR